MRLTTKANSAAGARRLNVDASSALRSQLEDQQNQNKIPDNQRVKLSVLNAASNPTLLRGRSHTGSILALMLALICTISLAHILEAIRPRRESDGRVAARRRRARTARARPTASRRRGAEVTPAAEGRTQPTEPAELPRQLVR